MSELNEKIQQFNEQPIKILIPENISYTFNSIDKTQDGGETVSLPRNESHFLVQNYNCVIQYIPGTFHNVL